MYLPFQTMYLPFQTMYCRNGHSFIEIELRRQGVVFGKDRRCYN